MSAEKMEVHPTRLELLRLKRRKALAEGIADILQKDLETLIIALVEFRQKANAFRSQMHEKINEAYSSFIEAEMIIGSINIKELSGIAPSINFGVDVGTTKGVLGLPFSVFSLTRENRGFTKPRFNILETPVQLEEAVSEISEALNFIIKLAELMATIREILEMISLKRRQINRIRFRIIPQLDATIKYVELILEEIERQDAIRVRVLQRKRKERAAKST
jgi:V/A-type H+-transporting ATPase subunit D